MFSVGKFEDFILNVASINLTINQLILKIKKMLALNKNFKIFFRYANFRHPGNPDL